ncbi:PIN/TRAM domain-containing protein [Planococcus shenhongbingii]|uniref:PIN/TRAM domain-containing protein n=1 Tax=Planococcus shenhongbingii TaxID=3058398 RepID=A0ABT8NI88_9BACL|nr:MULTISPECIES: PIN/TRAM domain-containing protein [unclassified Planococcus (in: firmicutes)]MDN7247478.1 PIN/TRAM domain-containing protein [Planococcus sp. N017]WKA58680.1 PIN/TRAM domain-containing protein [Planococcus sp. N016]
MLKKIIQILFLLIGAAVGIIFLPYVFELIPILDSPWVNNAIVSAVIGAIIFFLLSLLFADLIVKFMKWMEEKLLHAPTPDLLFGTIGLIIGLVVAFLIGFALNTIEIPIVATAAPIILSVVLGYLGFAVGFQKREEIISMLVPQRLAVANKKPEIEAPVEKVSYKLLDTSVIIDGRIADISATGFMEGTFVVPQFVLSELQHIADSSDTLKRTRGRRGLDILKRLQSEREGAIMITEESFDEVSEVDLKLMRAAKKMGGQVVTNDFNLNKVCELHNVPVLNINDLANAVKPVVIPGEDMHVVVIKDGKEQNQGVAYLDDGTMIVIEDGKGFIGQAIDVTVTSVLQTSAGRMIFAKPREGRQASMNG